MVMVCVVIQVSLATPGLLEGGELSREMAVRLVADAEWVYPPTRSVGKSTPPAAQVMTGTGAGMRAGLSV
jgi:hypothetical protein